MVKTTVASHPSGERSAGGRAGGAADSTIRLEAYRKQLVLDVEGLNFA